MRRVGGGPSSGLLAVKARSSFQVEFPPCRVSLSVPLRRPSSSVRRAGAFPCRNSYRRNFPGRSRNHGQALICGPLRTETEGVTWLVLLSSTSPRTDTATTDSSFRLTWLLCCEIHEIGISTYQIGAQMLQVDFLSWSYNGAAIHSLCIPRRCGRRPRILGARWN